MQLRCKDTTFIRKRAVYRRFFKKVCLFTDDFLINSLVYSHSGSIHVLGSLLLVLAYLIDEEVLSANALVGLYCKFFIPPFLHTS